MTESWADWWTGQLVNVANSLISNTIFSLLKWALEFCCKPKVEVVEEIVAFFTHCACREKAALSCQFNIAISRQKELTYLRVEEGPKEDTVHVETEDPSGMLKDSSGRPQEALLDFAYLGDINWARYSDCKQDVLVLACKYEDERAKALVEQQLAGEITVEGFTEMVQLANTYPCEHLRKACLDFLSSHYSDVVITTQFGVLMRERGAFAEELFGYVRATTTPATAAADEGGTV